MPYFEVNLLLIGLYNATLGKLYLTVRTLCQAISRQLWQISHRAPVEMFRPINKWTAVTEQWRVQVNVKNMRIRILIRLYVFLWGWNVVNFTQSVASGSFYSGSKPWFLCKVVNLYWNALHSLKCTLWKKSSLFNILTQYICHANLISISSIIISAHACDTNWIVKEIAELFTAKETANVYLKINFLQLKKIGNSASHCKSFCQLL